MTMMSLPVFQTNLTGIISPGEVVFNRGLQFFMAGIIRVVQGKLLQGGEMGFNPIQPGCRRGSPVKLDPVRSGVDQYFCFQVKRGIVQYNMQDFAATITPAQPFQKRQKRRPILLFGEALRGLDLVPVSVSFGSGPAAETYQRDRTGRGPQSIAQESV